MMDFLLRKELGYTALDPIDASIDGWPSSDGNDKIWRQRFNILLVSSISIIALLLGVIGLRPETQCYPSLESGIKVPFCRC
jgi:hypothetical protein